MKQESNWERSTTSGWAPPYPGNLQQSVETAIEKAVILQPFVEEITVRLNRNLMTENPFGYSELSGLMFDVEIVTRVGFSYCRARLAPENGYPLMRIVECNEITGLSRH